jgi:hypothetical protein
MTGNSGASLEHLASVTVCNTLGLEQSRLRVLEPAFIANGAEVGGVRERAPGSPTHPLTHRGAWRRRAGRGSSAPPLAISYGLRAPGSFAPRSSLLLLLPLLAAGGWRLAGRAAPWTGLCVALHLHLAQATSYWNYLRDKREEERQTPHLAKIDTARST